MFSNLLIRYWPNGNILKLLTIGSTISLLNHIALNPSQITLNSLNEKLQEL